MICFYLALYVIQSACCSKTWFEMIFSSWLSKRFAANILSDFARLQHRWASWRLSMSEGCPPFETGIIWSTVGDKGWGYLYEGSTGFPHIPHIVCVAIIFFLAFSYAVLFPGVLSDLISSAPIDWVSSSRAIHRTGYVKMPTPKPSRAALSGRYFILLRLYYIDINKKPDRVHAPMQTFYNTIIRFKNVTFYHILSHRAPKKSPPKRGRSESQASRRIILHKHKKLQISPVPHTCGAKSTSWALIYQGVPHAHAETQGGSHSCAYTRARTWGGYLFRCGIVGQIENY